MTERVELHLLRTGDRFRSGGVTFRADDVGPNVVVATVLDGSYRGAGPGHTAYIPTGGPRDSLRVEYLGGDPPEAA